MEIVPYGGWERCARIVCNDLELLVTLEVGPRIIRAGFLGEENILHEKHNQMGLTGGSDYRSYGGHRLWAAPEIKEITLQPDNGPVAYSMDDAWHVFTPEADGAGLVKEMRIMPQTDKNCFALEHRIRNVGEAEVTLAPWSLTQMAPGGVCIFPQAPFVSQSERVLPSRPLVLWGYTDMSDPRWSWGKKLVRLQQSKDGEPQKLGALVQQGYAFYGTPQFHFLMTFQYEEGASYPDFGCNFEVYTRQDMLEMESLGPESRLLTGQQAIHRENWYLMRGTGIPEAENECAEWLENLVADKI